MKTLANARKEGVQENTIYNADCLDIMRLMKDKSVDLVVTDPPYGIRADENPIKSKFKYGKTNWDRQAPSQEYFDEMRRISKNQIIWGGNYFTDKTPPSMGWIIWDKELREFSLADGEMAWTSFDRAMRIFTQNRPNAKAKDGFWHPTQKSNKLMQFCIQYADKAMHEEIKTILDPFLGSGTTAIAAKQLNRRFIGIEISQKYCSIAEDRLRQGMLF